MATACRIGDRSRSAERSVLKVTVDNQSSEPATLFVAEEDEGGMLRLVGSATPNVVPPVPPSR